MAKATIMAAREMSKEVAKELDRAAVVNKVWDDAIADTERKIEGYKRRIATLRTTARILRGLKKKDAQAKRTTS